MYPKSGLVHGQTRDGKRYTLVTHSAHSCADTLIVRRNVYFCTVFAKMNRHHPRTPFARWAYDRFVPESAAIVTARSTLLIFDGDCAFCTTWINWLARKLPR